MRDVVLVTGHLGGQIAGNPAGICDGYDLHYTRYDPRFHGGILQSESPTFQESENGSEPVVAGGRRRLSAETGWSTGRRSGRLNVAALLLDSEFSSDDDDPMLVPVGSGRAIDFESDGAAMPTWWANGSVSCEIAATEFLSVLLRSLRGRRREVVAADPGRTYDECIQRVGPCRAIRIRRHELNCHAMRIKFPVGMSGGIEVDLAPIIASLGVIRSPSFFRRTNTSS